MGRWVIIASERGQRPSTFQALPRKPSPTLCPFCAGHESATPPEVMAFRPDDSEPNQPGWTLRVISNKYPALVVEGDLRRKAIGLYDKMHGVGAHEVIIETPDHNRQLTDLSDEEVRDIFWAYRERMLDLARDIRLKYILVFKNHGEAAGASLEHSHSQLIATPIVPKRVSEKIDGSRKYYDFKERCILCDIVGQELNDRERIVSDHDAFVSLQPFAPRFPFESWILPKAHQSSFLEMSESEYLALARAVKDMLLRLKLALNDPPLNYVLHTRPIARDCHEYFHWHIEIIPKLTRVAGFEWGSGFYINPTSPEEAAAYLRQIDVSGETAKVNPLAVERPGG
jgi:UDPglucose--hexose-1-phosphate uridylyltransferase